MEQIVKSILFIKIFAFILLTGICHFKNNVQDKDSNILELEQNIKNNTKCKKKDIAINEKGEKDKNKKSNKSSLNKAQYYTEVIDYNNGMFDGKHFHFEKKWIKKKDYDNFLERNRRICDISLRKIRFRKYSIGIAMFFIFLLLGIGIPILSSLPSLKEAWESITNDGILNKLKVNVEAWGDNVLSYLIIALFSVLMVMLAVMLIVGFYKILRNNEKYNKIKLIKA
ncbi:fam-m protein [Plasmodium brasilianum]|uniref:Fam-m protein n=2 Tax=Plasmodium (Plasmodium) TaxID=418103 RepID=A0A1D3TDJ2_PLAMA|nr:fam-m protein [Plasmodium malariae]KAI4836001.1 fam-m protein [Plasmodium brasilianum]SCP02971.1 fam-m protein [Plasmodium malariae]